MSLASLGRFAGRQIMLDDSDVHHHRHSKAAVGGVAAAALGDPAVFVSVDAMRPIEHVGREVLTALEVLRAAMAQGHGDHDMAAVVQQFREVTATR